MTTGVVMVNYFIDKLIDGIEKKKSHICVGLDPHLDQLPPSMLKNALDNPESKRLALARVIRIFNQTIIDNIAEVAVAVKPQMAFYEVLGNFGISVLEETVKYAKNKGLIVILDGKRNDIGSTARAYAEAYLGDGKLETTGGEVKYAKEVIADAITINPYFGFDGIEPFISREERGAFPLVRTSNPGAGELQDLKLADGRKLYQEVGRLVEKWGKEVRGENNYSNLGAVVGATYPGELKQLRKLMPHTYFLIPGYGAQGGRTDDVLAGFNEDGLGALINSARGIIFAYSREPWSEEYEEDEYGQAARAAAIQMRDEINQALE